jgi:hypothetical protein
MKRIDADADRRSALSRERESLAQVSDEQSGLEAARFPLRSRDDRVAPIREVL